jgi:quercetin dioxygenase-like cupin family protein
VRVRSDQGERHADHPELPRDQPRPRGLVHRCRLYRHRRYAHRATRLAAASVHFTPGARTAWHTHPFGQTIFVTEGSGLCQRRGGPIETIRPGDRVFFEAGENHWHGAGPDRFMTHLAMQEVDDSGSPVSWGEQVSDEEYGAAPGTGS